MLPSHTRQLKIIVTEASKHFLDRSEAYNGPAHAAFASLDPPIPVLGDADEWRAWDAVGDPVLHIQVFAYVISSLVFEFGVLFCSFTYETTYIRYVCRRFICLYLDSVAMHDFLCKSLISERSGNTGGVTV